MNIAKHMEAVLLSALAIIAATSFATAAVPAFKGAPLATSATVSAAPFTGPMQVVTIVGKRQPRA